MEFYSGCGYTDHAFLINDVIVQVITTIQIGISHCKEGNRQKFSYGSGARLELKLKDRVNQGYEVRGCGMDWWNGMVEWITGMVECFIGHIYLIIQHVCIANSELYAVFFACTAGWMVC